MQMLKNIYIMTLSSCLYNIHIFGDVLYRYVVGDREN